MPRPSSTTVDDAPPAASSPAAQRTEQILQAAVALFSTRGYVPTTIDDICAEIGVGKGLIYRYFRDKRDVLFHAICAVLEKYRDADFAGHLAAEGPLGALRWLLGVHCRLNHDHTQETVLAYRSTKDLLPEQREHIKALETELVAEIRRCLEAGVDAGLIREVELDVLAYQVLMYGHTWALKRWTLEQRHSIDGYVAAGEKLLIEPFLTDAGARELQRLRAAARRPHGR